MRLLLFTLLFAALAPATRLHSQIPLIDRGQYVDGLWCFPLHTDSLTYVYLPTQGRLMLDEQNNPKFSYLRYVINKTTEGNTNKSITDADGGGILHFLVLYDTPEKTVRAAEETLRKKNGNNNNLKLRGPITFDKGSYALISSIINEKTNKEEKKLLAVGDAPVLENSSIALSFGLTPVQSKLLLESFKMKTPDISVVFDLAFSGLTEAYDAELEIDWSEVKKSEAFSAGASVYFVSADIALGFEKLRRDNAIRLRVNGSSGSLEGLLNTVYDRLLTMLFKPAEAEKVDQQGGLNSALNALLGPNGPLGSRQTTGFGLNVGYQMKDFQSTGQSRLFFKGRNTVQRHHFVAFNIGNLYQKYGANPDFFKDVPLWDPAFQQREIFVGIDGDLEKEFQKMLNSVTVVMRKQHASGQVTLGNLLVNKETFKNYKPLSVVYGYDADSNRVEWMNYDHKFIWQFQGGGSYETPWEESAASMINVFTPFTRKVINLDGDLAALQNKGIKAVNVTVTYPFFGKVKKEMVKLRPADNISEKYFEITLPNDVEEVEYEVLWIKSDGNTTARKGKDKYGLIFVDEPAN